MFLFSNLDELILSIHLSFKSLFMNSKIFILLVILLHSLKLGYAQNSSQQYYNEIFSRTAANYSDVHSSQFRIEYYNKCFDCDSISLISAEVMVVNAKTDTLFRKYFHYTMDKQKEDDRVIKKFYNGDYLYVIVDSVGNNGYIEFDAHKGLTSPITGTKDGNILGISDLFDQRILNKIFSETGHHILLFDTLINDKKYIVHKTLFEDGDDFTNRQRIIFIDPNSYTIERVFISVNYFHQIQIDDYVIKNLKLNAIDKQNLDKIITEELSGLEKNVYVKKEFKPLELGTTIEDFSIMTYPNKEEKVIQLKERIVLLDFWYTACLPCTKSIPDINTLYSKYNEQIDFYAINMSIEDFNDLSKVERFTEIVPIHSEIVFGHSSLFEKLMIIALPSIYILHDGELIYLNLGYDPNKDVVKEIELLLEEVIEK